jgi:hypothetical protein
MNGLWWTVLAAAGFNLAVGVVLGFVFMEVDS